MEKAVNAPIAILGMACRLPGADNLEEFWQLVIEGRCAIVEAPPERLDQQLYYDPRRGVPAKTYTKLGGVINYHPFDPSTCPVPPRILPGAEIGPRTICQVAADACRDAGMNPFDLPLRNAGVYVGNNLGGEVAANLIYATMVEQTAEYLREVDRFRQIAAGGEEALIAEVVGRIRDGLPRRGPTGAPEALTRMAAAIISEAFGLSGPAMILDAACSSAMQGLAMAVRALRLGRIEMAIVGGASFFCVDSLMLFSRAQSASANGSYPFDARADGLVSGEGYVALVLKTLPRAIADGDPVCAVIRGVGVSSDGRGKTLWAPRKEGQAEAIRRAYQGGIDITRLQYVEAHATSTQAGDVTETAALAEVLRQQMPPGTRIPMGGVKANIGHTLETAGLAGLVKTVLAIRHKTIPQQINCRELNPQIDWDNAPFFVPTKNLPWPAFDDGHPRRAGVNSFGIGGLNVHVVIDEHAQPTGRPSAATAGPADDHASGAHQPIAIVGAGCIFPGARTLDAYWELLGSGRDPKCEAPADRWNTQIGYQPGARCPWRSPTKRGGFIIDFQYDWRRHRIPPKQISVADPLQFMILDATDAALADAGYDTRPYDNKRVGVVVGTVFGSDFCEQLQIDFRLPHFRSKLAEVLRARGVAEEDVAAISEGYGEVLLKHLPGLMDETGSFTPSALASRIARTYDLMGGAAALDAGQASSLAALYSAVDMLLDGSCEMVVCAAGHRAMGLPTYETMSLGGSLAGDDPKAPFDADAKGCLPGEGVGVLILKRLADARRDGDPIRGIIRGIGAGFAASPRDALKQAIQRAQQSSGTGADEVMLLETSGTGLAEQDDQEIAAVAEGLAADSRQQPLLLGSVVGQIGHTQGASGMASLIKASMALRELKLPSTFGAATPAPSLQVRESLIRLATEDSSLEPPGPERPALAGINSIDSLGAAYHVVLERGAEVPAAGSTTPETSTLRPAETPAAWRIVRLGAASMRQLCEAVGKATAESQALFAGSGSVEFSPADECRLAIVACDAADLEKKLQLAAERLDGPKAATLARKEVFFGRVTRPAGQLAFLFSGQGSQYPGMLRTLIEEFPPAADAMRRIDSTLQRLGIGHFAEVAWERGEALGGEVWPTQLSLLCADTIIHQSLEALGVRPDCVAGHSFGEFPALVAAGAWCFEDAVRGTRARCRAIEECRGAEGQMLSTSAPGPVVEKLCEQIEGRVFPANYNSPDQTVAGGEKQALTRLAERLKEERFAGIMLPVPRPFHTPLMEGVRKPLAEGLRSIAFRSPQVPLLSGVSNRFVSEPDEIRENLISQMTTPLRYVELIGQLADKGVRAMVEVGPRQVLTGLHAKILAGRGVALIASDDQRRGGLRQLLAVRACLETIGLTDRPQRGQPVDVFAATSREPVEPAAAAPKPKTATTAQPSGTPTDERPEVSVFTGTPYETGVQHGRAMAEQIRYVARRYADMAGTAGMQGGFVAAGEPWDGQLPDAFSGEEREELRGIAEAAGVSLPMLAAYNTWLDLAGVERVVQLALGPGGSGTAGLLHALDDRPARHAFRRGFPAPGLRVYRPAKGLAHVVVAAPGQIGASAGMNQQGLAVSSAAISPQPPGLPPAALRTLLLRRVLSRATDLDAAVEMLRDVPEKTGWEFCLSHAKGDRVCRLRRDGSLQQVQSDRAVVAAVSQALTPAVTTAATGETPSDIPELPELNGANEEPDSDDARVLDLCRLLDEADPPGADQVGQLRAEAEARFGVLMYPGRGEIALRASARNDAAGPDLYRLEPAAEQAPGSEASGQPDRQPTPIPAIPLEEYLAASRSVEGRPPFDAGGDVCPRFVLRMLRTPFPEVEESLAKLNGPAMILGQNAVARALQKQIEELGSKAVMTPAFDDVETALAEVEKIWQEYHPPHLFIVTSFDDDAQPSIEPAEWQRRRKLGIMLPYLVCQKWFQLVTAEKMVERSSVVAATAMGGDFGLSGRIECLESGAIAGLIKALCIEVGYTTDWAFRTKVVDAPRSEPPEEVAAALLRELRAVAPFEEIAYADGQRYVIGAIHRLAEPAPGSEPTRGKPWVITGGARGITAAVARELAARFGVKLHLVGNSPAPQIDPAWRNLSPEQSKQLRAELAKQAVAQRQKPAELWSRAEKAIEIDKTLRGMVEAGIEAVYHCCDVSDRDALGRLLEEIRRADGPIEGIIHGAGIEVAGRFAKKDPQMVSRTIAAKVDGAAALMNLTRNDPLRFFFGFGSVAGRMGSIGQTDYCLASEMLCKLVDWYRTRRPDCHATCFHWQPWAEVGMAARPETQGANMLQNLKLLPPAEGIRRFVDELLAGAPEPEVLIADWEYYKRYYPDLSEEEVAKWYLPESKGEPKGDSPIFAARKSGQSPARKSGQSPARKSGQPPSSPEGGKPERVATRYLMRMVEEPLEDTIRRAFSFAGPALIVGDNADALALQQRLKAAGVEAERLPIHDRTEETLAELQWMWGAKPAPHLFIMTGRDPEAVKIDSREAWLRRRSCGVMLPFLLCQKWLTLVAEADLSRQASLVAATSLGGDFGLARPVVAPEGGGLAGLLKALYMEVGGKSPEAMTIKVVDAPADEPPEQLAAAILDELTVEAIDIEAAYNQGKRSVVRLMIEPVEQLPRSDLRRGGNWVFTGGARGITAAVAAEMGRRYGLKLHLLGKSSPPEIDPAWHEYSDDQMRQLKRSLVRKAVAEGQSPDKYWGRVRKDLEIDQNLRGLKSAGVQATYHCCDVTDWEQLQQTLQQIRQNDGPIEGIVHGAGISGNPTLIGDTSEEIASELIDVKVDAAVALMLLTAEDPLKYFVGFGSISGRFGTTNGSSYSQANDMMCKLIGWLRHRRPGAHGVGFHWHPWGEVGMMTRPVSQHTIKVMKMKMMPPGEGADHLIEELRAGAPESEVMITDSQYHETFYSKEIVISGEPAGRPAAEPAPESGVALLGQVTMPDPGRLTAAEMVADPTRDPFLREHRLRDKPTLPMVVALEAFAELAVLADPGRQSVIAVRDVQISDAVRLFSDQPHSLRVVAELTQQGVDCRLTSDFFNRRGQLVQKGRLHFSASVELAEQPVMISSPRPQLPAEWFDVTYPPKGSVIYHGPPLRLLRKVAVDESGGWGQIHLPAENELAGGRVSGRWLTPSAAIDACFYACGVYTWVSADGAVTIPDSLQQLRFGRPVRPAEQTLVHVVCRELEGNFGVFDFTLFGDDEAVVFRAEGYRCHVLRGTGK